MTMPIQYCELSGHDNKSYYFERTDAPACAGCGLVTDLEWINPRLRLNRKGLDFSYTYDLTPIASARFALFASRHSGARFLPLPGVNGFYLMIVDPIVRVDPTSIRMKDRCIVCGRYTQVAGGSTPVPGEQIPVGFSRTDAVFGSARDRPDRKTCQHPITLVDSELGRLLPQERFKGLIIAPIEAQ